MAQKNAPALAVGTECSSTPFLFVSDPHKYASYHQPLRVKHVRVSIGIGKSLTIKPNNKK